MKIVNNTNLCYAKIGKIIDLIIQEGKEDTIYYGKTDIATVEVLGKEIQVQIRYLKKYVEWRFYEKENN